MKNFKIFAFVYVLSVLPLQGQKVTKEDYNRAVSFNYGNLVNKTVFNLKTDVFWFKNNSGLWFVDYAKNKKNYKSVDFNTKKVSELFNHNKLADALSKNLNKEIKASELSLYQIEKSNGVLFFSTEKKVI